MRIFNLGQLCIGVDISKSGLLHYTLLNGEGRGIIAGIHIVEKNKQKAISLILWRFSLVVGYAKEEPLVQYHRYTSCNKCGEENAYTVTDSLDGHVHTCKTECKVCGFEDYWCQGFYESSRYMKSNCEKYSFGGKR